MYNKNSSYKCECLVTTTSFNNTPTLEPREKVFRSPSHTEALYLRNTHSQKQSET